MAHYRIVEDEWAGYEVQAWRWWFPFWVQCGFTNTHGSIEAAKRYAERHAAGVERFKLRHWDDDSDAPGLVINLGELGKKVASEEKATEVAKPVDTPPAAS